MPAFVMERCNWRRSGPATWVRLPGENAVGTFDTADDAHAEQARMEAEVRAVVGHPFRCGESFRELTTLPEYAFLDWLRDADIEAPDLDPDGRRPWLAWADLYSGEWTPSQLGHIWEGCNRVRFYRVRERAGEVLYGINRIHYSREFTVDFVDVYEPATEGGTPTALWQSRRSAETHLHFKQQLAAEEVVAAMVTTGDEGVRYDPTRRAAAGSPFAVVPPATPVDAGEACHCELFEVERGESECGRPLEPLGETAFVVLRHGWDAMRDGSAVEVPGLFDHREESGGVPVRVFRRREDAERFRDGCEAEFRSFANPFALWMPGVRGFGWESGRVVRAIRELRLPPPDLDTPTTENPHQAQRAACVHWWAVVGDRLTDDQRAELWELNWYFDQQHALYSVHEVRVDKAGTRPHRRVRTLYYVRATNWSPGGGPGHNPHRFLGAFVDRSRAEEVRDEAERTFRESPPPELGPPMAWEDPEPWEALSGMTQPQARQHLIDHGLIDDTVHPLFFPDPHWWEHNRSRFHPRQVRALWQVFDRVRLYEVLALETEVGE